ncbi:hypothetical protein PPL_04366 [Heterostelium album PN500]|uniref:Uncharacterized protein n=1 Tax=Heterostelium pallidum (strain ATCC 26659 / Pp 5 / PN500) TaxID=670386 RepID=D3B7C9_HETP5|nr:hypothetical protein PPL_04366 [Heterostelium album PN500]EFA82672.1 hypothetical protein PPL_04366 [Heterostelium album PN500]|eukprot:XP_020434789.1 hypothetical protein PPL_04366 [Heterostelium album PN500]
MNCFLTIKLLIIYIAILKTVNGYDIVCQSFCNPYEIYKQNWNNNGIPYHLYDINVRNTNCNETIYAFIIGSDICTRLRSKDSSSYWNIDLMIQLDRCILTPVGGFSISPKQVLNFGFIITGDTPPSLNFKGVRTFPLVNGSMALSD